MNDLYEYNYSKMIEPKYGPKRNVLQDEILTEQIHKEHLYSIGDDERVDMTLHDTYTIDPIGCEDADDAFSIFTNNDKLYLAIHIADPTEYIDLNSILWNDIVKRTTTKYPSNRKSIHMMPNKIVKLSSLIGNIHGEIKKSITILTEIDFKTYEPINEIKLLFTTIFVKKENGLNYNEASTICEENNSFNIGLKISNTLKKKRSLKTKGVKLNEIYNTNIIYETDNVYLHEDTKQEKMMKEMIAEFAIFANSFVGEYLKINLNIGIFRSCVANDWLKTIYNEISGEELLQEIIMNGIKAEYISNIKSHDLVGMPEYCHFTSPIRRLTDCVCHYLLKYIYFNSTRKKYNIPFSELELEKLSNDCMKKTRLEKKNQYLDTKFRLLQVMDNMISKNNKIDIQYYITGYSGLFLNIIICNVNHFQVHVSYTLRLKNYTKIINSKEKYLLSITKVNCFTDYDENTIPELDRCFL